MRFFISNVCEAFKSNAVGSKVNPQFHQQFFAEVEQAINLHDFSTDKVRGQMVLTLPEHVNAWVSPGSWERPESTSNIEFVHRDYVMRVFRNEVGLYLRRKPEMVSNGVAVVVYSAEAYRNDPDFDEVENALMNDEYAGDEADVFVIVAVLGYSGPASTVSYSRFVKNLAGANNEYIKMTKDEVVAKAKEVIDYRSKYMGVAD